MVQDYIERVKRLRSECEPETYSSLRHAYIRPPSHFPRQLSHISLSLFELFQGNEEGTIAPSAISNAGSMSHPTLHQWQFPPAAVSSDILQAVFGQIFMQPLSHHRTISNSFQTASFQSVLQ
ncbi:hypothetical protein O6H91_15G014300 [Diphasiastrum complanatum]|uniref:Uncharacterized protein n=1 Tax=Diphasiastrum complanatum TaxID=34168 RepID=A0ACC2BG05_DIPCM|nr:hypothetical protein O6H91_15G014300 [Diphasiastrum complanatum]